MFEEHPLLRMKWRVLEVHPNFEELFTFTSFDDCDDEVARMISIPGTNRFWVVAGRDGSAFPTASGLSRPQKTIVAHLCDADSKQVIKEHVLSDSYGDHDCLALARAPNGKVLFALEEGGPDAMMIAIADANGEIAFSSRNVFLTEPEGCQAVAYDDNSFGLFVQEDESEQMWAVYFDEFGLKQSSIMQVGDRYNAWAAAFAAFASGKTHTLVYKPYSQPDQPGSSSNRRRNYKIKSDIVALNAYKGYLAVRQKAATPGKVTVQNFSPKSQKVVVMQTASWAGDAR
eukprot:gb/GFBE01023464.1/.p1 GENE.gb/GFBE01023464.1/~~gb/GFBE01023464.1/.p1  ORF type:complete len:286 (+),score=37.91 gb/GFBE01023464.1/:1-858(+)